METWETSASDGSGEQPTGTNTAPRVAPVTVAAVGHPTVGDTVRRLALRRLRG
jgi:hypothetical protein